MIVHIAFALAFVLAIICFLVLRLTNCHSAYFSFAR